MTAFCVSVVIPALYSSAGIVGAFKFRG